MQLYNTLKKQIENISYIQNEKGTFYVEFLSAGELIKNGFKPIKQAQYPSNVTQRQEVKEVITESERAYEISYEVKDIDLDRAKKIKQNELKNYIVNTLEKNHIKVEGVSEIDTGYNYLLNAEALINYVEANGLNEIDFRMYDNSIKKLNLEQLKKIKLAIETRGIQLHAIKWQYENAISNAKNVSELEAIKWK